MPITPVITYNGNQRTISYDVRPEQEAARAKTEAEALAGGANAIAADSAGNAVGNEVGANALRDVGASLASLDDNPNAGTTNNVAQNQEQVTSGAGANTSQSPASPPVPLAAPGARKTNPLNGFISSAYCISLYMVTPEFYNQMIASNPPATLSRTGNGVYVVAQSAGISNTFDNRLLTLNGQLGRGQPGLDYFIEDLSLTTLFPGGPNRASVASAIKFKIVEPVGFTFMQKLRVASDNICKLSSMLKSTKYPPLPINQNFILGIRFYGYDSSGNIIMPKGSSLNSDSNSVAERFIPIRIASMKFKIDDKATIYSCEANQLPEQVAFGSNAGVIKSKTELSGRTVGEVLGASTSPSKTAVSLVKYVNAFNQTQKDQNNIAKPNTFTVEFIGDAKTLIGNAKLVDDDEFESVLTAASNTKKTNESTVKESFNATTLNVNSRTISIAAGTSISQVIDNIIIKSSYISDATKQIFSGSPETKSVRNSATKALKWYSINPVTKITGRDDATNDWVYDVSYQISLYEVPYIRNQYVANTTQYPGAYKVYNYMYTGLNTEVLEYEQTYDSLYYIPISPSSGINGNTNGKNKEVSKQVQAGVNSDATMGKTNRGSEINDNIRASLYSPGDQAIARMKVIGDPDLISTVVGTDLKKTNDSQGGSNSPQQAATKWYGADYTVNPTAGQMFIQIVFNVAEDYLTNGLMDVSDKIQFYTSNDVQRSGIKGVIYKLYQVESNFMKGMFTQQLEAVIVTANNLLMAGNKSTGDSNTTDNQRETPTTGDTTTGISGTNTTDTRTDSNNQSGDSTSTTNTGTIVGSSIAAPGAGQTLGYNQALLDQAEANAREKAVAQQRALDDQQLAQSSSIWNSPERVPDGFVTINGSVIGASSRTSRWPPGSYGS